jgi:DNA (cytosine-5)-methyltransferase 1
VRIGSLFSGYGGLDRAVMDTLGGTVAWHVEHDKHPSAILAAHYPDVPNYGDVTAVDWAAVEPVDVLTGGYPCQPFSHAGKRKGEHDERHLWPWVEIAIGALRPRIVVLENVAGHLTLGGTTVVGSLAGLGYGARWGVVRASDAGAAHRRARLFIVAYTDGEHGDGCGDLGPGRWTEPTDRRVATADADVQRREELGGAVADGAQHPGAGNGDAPTPDAEGHEQREPAEPRPLRHEPGASARHRAVDFGQYTPAIRRWESVIGRPAPDPTEPGRNGPRLSALFVEFLMGLPDGWVTGVPIPRNAQLKALGNGVVPQQAAMALRLLEVAA